MTNPDPLYHPRNLTMFDPSPPGPQPDDDILPKAAHTLGNMLAAAAGICHGICKVSGTRLPRTECITFLLLPLQPMTALCQDKLAAQEAALHAALWPNACDAEMSNICHPRVCYCVRAARGGAHSVPASALQARGLR